MGEKGLFGLFFFHVENKYNLKWSWKWVLLGSGPHVENKYNLKKYMNQTFFACRTEITSNFVWKLGKRSKFVDFFRLYLFSAWGQLAPKTHFRVARVITPSGSLKSTCVMMKLSSLTPAVFSTTQFLLDSLLSRYSWHPSTAMRWGRAGKWSRSR